MTKKKSSDDLVAEFEKLADDVANARERMMEVGAEAFEAYTKSLFEKYPELDAFVILGWTPGFNDGDPCTHSMDVMVTGDDFSDNGHEDEVEDILDCLGKLEEITDEQVEAALTSELADKKNRDPEDEEDLERERRWKRQELEVNLLNKGLAKKDADQIRKCLYSFDEVLEQTHDTNWKLTFTRDKSGKCHVEKDDYDCGH